MVIGYLTTPTRIACRVKRKKNETEKKKKFKIEIKLNGEAKGKK